MLILQVMQKAKLVELVLFVHEYSWKLHIKPRAFVPK